MGFLADTIIWDFNVAAARASGSDGGANGELILCRLSQHKVKVYPFHQTASTSSHWVVKMTINFYYGLLHPVDAYVVHQLPMMHHPLFHTITTTTIA
jgi:hypothetical protein